MQNQKERNPNETILSIVILLLIIFLLSGKELFLYAALAIGLISLISNSSSKAINLVWSKVIRVVGLINAHIFLGLIFCFVLIPISFFYRIFNKDSLNLKEGKTSYFAKRDHLYGPDDLKNMW